MKIWKSCHIFDHSWETITKAAWQKYPNPLNTSVDSIDVVDRSITENGTLLTHRLIRTFWHMPSWIQKVVSINSHCFVSEKSELNAREKLFTLYSTNISMAQNAAIEEKIVYKPHPSDNNKTLMVTESTILIKGVPLTNYLESMIENTMEARSHAGRQAMEWVIKKINNEVQDTFLPNEQYL